MADLSFYRSRLRVNKHDLDGELEVQSQYQEEISRELALANSRMLEAKDTLSRTEARLYLDLKSDKVSDTAANAAVKVDRGRMEDWQLFQRCREEHEQWLGLYDAWQRRGYSIKTMSDLYVAQYFSVTAVSSSNASKEVAVDTMRAAMRQAHRSREVVVTPEPSSRRRINGSG